jgi:hypothetical protein
MDSIDIRHIDSDDEDFEPHPAQVINQREDEDYMKYPSIHTPATIKYNPQTELMNDDEL